MHKPLACWAVCRTLFAELQAGPHISANPTAFVGALQLDHTVQQDGQEFLKLLLSLLEKHLQKSMDQVGPSHCLSPGHWSPGSLSRDD